MVSPKRLSRRGLLPAAFLLQLIVGCSSVDVVALKEQEIADLQFRTDRMRESLREYDAENRRLTEALRSTRRDEGAVRGKADDLSNDLRLAREQLDTVKAQREGLRVRLQNAEDANRRLQESLTRIKDVAGESAGELSDLRVRRAELEERLKSVTQTNNSLSAESSRLSKEVEKLTAELTKTRAVARSLQDGTEAAVSLETQELRSQLEELKRANADVRGKLVAVEKRLEHAQQKADEAAVIPVGSVYTDDPAGLAKEVQTFLAGRWNQAKEGELAWDAFDLSVMGVVAALLLTAGFVFLRWLRGRRLKRERNALRVMVQDLEDTLSRGVSSARAGSIRSSGSRPSVRPQSRFSAVVTTPSEKTQRDAKEDEVESAETREPSPQTPRSTTGAGDPFEALLRKGGEADRIEAESLASGSPSLDPMELDEDDLANTQVMPSLSEVDLHEVVATPPKVEASKEDDSEDMEDDDKEILTELKSVINRKFDELLR